MTNDLFRFSIYTIISPARFKSAIQLSTPTKFDEAKAWKTGARLFELSKVECLSMPILFGDAGYCSRLMGWGILIDVNVSDEGTNYTAEQLQVFRRPHETQELVLKSTLKTIAQGFIRPYAICLTPPFLGEE